MTLTKKNFKQIILTACGGIILALSSFSKLHAAEVANQVKLSQVLTQVNGNFPLTNPMPTDIVSDHKAFGVTLSNGVNVYTFNILMQCNSNLHGFNNGFGIVETKDQYIARIENKVLPAIASIITQDSNAIIVLQEAPNATTAIFGTSRNKNINQFLLNSLNQIIGSKNHDITSKIDLDSGLIIIFNKTVYGCKNSQVDKANKLLMVSLNKLNTQDSFDVVNAHLPYQQKDEDKVNLLLNVATFVRNNSQTGRVVVIGDFNMRLNKLNSTLLPFHLFQNGGESIAWDAKSNRQRPSSKGTDNVDGYFLMGSW